MQEEEDAGRRVEEDGEWNGDADQRRGLRYLQLPLKEIRCCVNQTGNLQHQHEINAVNAKMYPEDCSPK